MYQVINWSMNFVPDGGFNSFYDALKFVVDIGGGCGIVYYLETSKQWAYYDVPFMSLKLV